MIGHHFSISAFCNSASACGFCCSRGKIKDAARRERNDTLPAVDEVLFVSSAGAIGAAFGVG
jgi:hypothetical protein